MCSFLGALQVPVFGGILLYATIGLIYDLKNRCKLSPSETISQTISHLLDVKAFYSEKPNDENDTTECIAPITESTPKTKEQLNIKELQSPMVHMRDESITIETDSIIDSGTFFIILFFTCTATIFYKHTWLFLFLSIPMIIYFICKFYKSSGLQEIITEKSKYLWIIVTVS